MRSTYSIPSKGEIDAFVHLLKERALKEALIGILAAHKEKYLSKVDQYK